MVGKKEGKGKKQLLLAIGGIHGNEHAGLKAFERVFGVLNNDQRPFNGCFVALAGNLQALTTNTRYIKSDLNRIWTDEDLKMAYNGLDEELFPEHKELRGLHDVIAQYLEEGYEQVALIDLHTTSAKGGVFIVCPDEEGHKKMITKLHVPVILNLDRDLQGTAMQYFWDRGITAFAFEGGNHEGLDSIDKMESALWLCLEYMRCISHKNYPEIDLHDQLLRKKTEELPHFCRLLYHHMIKEGDNFEMHEGFKNFQTIKKGETLAKDVNGEVTSSYDGFILMPLYQKKGSDGFFIVSPEPTE